MANHASGPPAWLTSDYLEKMLRDYSGDGSIRVKSSSIKPGSSVGDNYLGQIFHIEVKCITDYGKLTKTIIAKSLPVTKVSDTANQDIDLFKVEGTMFSETLPLLYKELMAKGESKRFFPFMYKLDVENKTIFMEDLKADGYVMIDKAKSLDLDHTLIVVKALAKMHAASYLLLQKNPAFKDNYLDYMFKKSKEEGLMEKFTKMAVKNITDCLDSWPLSEEDKKIVRAVGERLWDLATDGYSRKESNFNVLLHGDCWANNLMFKYKNGKVDSVKMIDYQLSNYNSFALDLQYLIFLCTRKDVKTEHLEEVLEVYYKTFISVTGKIEGFTLDLVKEEFYSSLGYGILLGIFFRPGMMVNEVFDLDAELEGRDTMKGHNMYVNPEYISEVVAVLPLFKKHGVFKL